MTYFLEQIRGRNCFLKSEKYIPWQVLMLLTSFYCKGIYHHQNDKKRGITVFLRIFF